MIYRSRISWLASPAVFLAGLSLAATAAAQSPTQPVLGSKSVPLLTVDKLHFRDLNRNGKLDPFEDWRLSPEQRTIDLLPRLSLEEKAGLMMHASAPAAGSPIGMGSAYDLPAAQSLIAEKKSHLHHPPRRTGRRSRHPEQPPPAAGRDLSLRHPAHHLHRPAQ